MMNRRDALKTAGIVAAGLATGFGKMRAAGKDFHSMRPLLEKRRFVSDAVEATIDRVAKTIEDDELAWMFRNCYPNTLDTTVTYSVQNGKPDTFIITGDIPAMWLRDSTAQVWPYLPLAKSDRKLQDMLAGVIHRQARCILLDPYANAFNEGLTGSEWDSDLTDMKPGLHERKWEIDSLCYPIRLSYGYWKTTGDASVFDAQWKDAMALVVKTFREQQRIHGRGPYHFQRRTEKWYDTLPFDGYGNPARPVGLIHSAFRPSDDSCIFPLLIPSNLFAVTVLRQLAEILMTDPKVPSLAHESRDLAAQVEGALQHYAIVNHHIYGKIYAYEVDGYGNELCMDDANVPSLLALPYLGCCSATDPMYERTRSFVLSKANPYYFSGSAGEGVGGPHVGMDMIWPLSIIMRALTSTDDREILHCLRMLKGTHAGTGFMHECFYKDDPNRYTRDWFAWANTLFGELIVKIHAERPQLLTEKI
jgi:meiotically up-regulated gene 157 (Mug157) protein